jgi:rubrerythrin
MTVKVFRCRICGDPYIGTDTPSRCPFCGGKAKYFVDARDWNPNEFNVDVSDLSRKSLEAALHLELGNAAFYLCATEKAKNAGNDYMEAKFKALRKVEIEHASAICKFLKMTVPVLEQVGCGADFADNSKEGHQREDKAIKSYARFRDEAVEPRLKEFFNALVEIETDHLGLHAADSH